MLFAILKTKKLQANCNLRNIHKQFGQHNTGEQHKGRQRSDSADPFAIGFPKSRIFYRVFSLQLFHRNSCKISVYCFRETRQGGLVRPTSKSGRFSHHPLRVPKAWHRDFAACGQRSGLLALNLANIFEKLLHRKTFYLPAACDWKNHF